MSEMSRVQARELQPPLVRWKEDGGGLQIPPLTQRALIIDVGEIVVRNY